jgi:glucose/arabinose dehydrogenase
LRLLAFAGVASLTLAGIAHGQEMPGKTFEIRPSDLPPPYATPSTGNSPDRVRRPEGSVPWVPPGYQANLFADNLDHARWLAVAETGEVFLAEPRAGKVTILVDSDGDGRADKRSTYTDGHDAPHGLALHGGYLYVADLDGVWRYPWQSGSMKARAKGERITPRGAFGDSGGHWTRNIAIAPDGKRFYVAIGSASNIAEDPAPRATVKAFRIDGSGGRIFASGLRNPVGIAFHPDTGALYTVVNERDGLGDGLVPDYMAALKDGGFYGWPYAYIGPNPQPDFADRRPDLVRRTIVPDVLFESHSAPMALLFAKGGNFPTDWQDDAFVAFRGSWNASVPTGYKVVRVPFENGRPTGAYENFVTGFRLDEPGRRTTARVWGRPVGLALAKDGSMLIAVDVDNSIWRISRLGR